MSNKFAVEGVGSFSQIPAHRFSVESLAAGEVGAIALGIVNPLLAIFSLHDAGPEQDNDARQMVLAACARSHGRSQSRR